MGDKVGVENILQHIGGMMVGHPTEIFSYHHFFLNSTIDLKFADKPTWVSTTDGDTPTFQLSIRIPGIDAQNCLYSFPSILIDTLFLI